MMLANNLGVEQIVSRWAHTYSDRKAVSETVTFVHLAGVLLGGGLAVAADRATLRLARAAPGGIVAGSPALAEIAGVHRLVLWGLALIFLSGLLQTLADLGTYLTSVIFWSKMAMVAMLIGNGWVRLRAERAIQGGDGEAWATYRGTSIASLVLWFLLVLLGTILTGNG